MCSFDVVFGIVCSAREWNRGGVRTLALGPLLLLLLGSGCCGCLKRWCQCLSSSNMSSTGAVPFCRMWVVRGLEGLKSLLNINPCARQLFECGPSRVCGWSVLSVKQSFSPRLQLISSRGRSNSLNSDDLHCSTFLSILFGSSCRNSVVQW